MNSKKRVGVAISGGVDSSTTAYLLLKEGYEVVGITGKMFDSASSDEIIRNSKEVCDKLGIEHHTIDLTEKFNKKIIKYFEESYKNGETPNPCIVCNKFIKWGDIFDYAINELNCDFYATGHYANIKEGKLTHANNIAKDQTYYLFELSPYNLSKTIFPLGKFESKDEIRELANIANLPSKSSKDSQDICFITPPDSVKKYLLRTFEKKFGDFIHIKTGKKLGCHDGFYQFTIGQRKGIGIAYSEPLYVIKIDAEKNIVYVGEKEHLFSNTLEIRDVNFQQEEFRNKEFKGMAKIRYNTTAKPCTVISEENTAKIIFNEDVSGITKGQACVVYDETDNFIILGGWIK